MTWDPRLYLEFDDQRFRPALELLARVDAEPARVVDLGCGTGAITAVLQRRWPHAEITGLDNSPEMLAVARADHPELQWVEADIRRWRPPATFGLVYSNAALQWLDDHNRLFPSLTAHLAAGGVLAVQMPRNHSQPAYRLIEQMARSPRWSRRLAGVLRPAPVHEPAFYYDVLARCVSDIDIWETEYLHVLTGDNPVVTWLSGTFARPILAALGDAAEDFRTDWAAGVAAAYPPQPDGSTLFPFRRLFIVARA